MVEVAVRKENRPRLGARPKPRFGSAPDFALAAGRRGIHQHPRFAIAHQIGVGDDSGDDGDVAGDFAHSW